MGSGNSKIGDLVRRGVVLFSGVVPIPASTFVAAVSAAVITKLLDLHRQRVSDILSAELTLPHIAGVEPDDEQIALFFARNPLYPALESEFDSEIREKNLPRLRQLYPLLYGALILKKQIPALLYHRELAGGQYRSLALQYEQLSHGYDQVRGDAVVDSHTSHFASDLFQVLKELYDPLKDELKNRKNQFAFDVIDYILQVAAL